MLSLQLEKDTSVTADRPPNECLYVTPSAVLMSSWKVIQHAQLLKIPPTFHPLIISLRHPTLPTHPGSSSSPRLPGAPPSSWGSPHLHFSLAHVPTSIHPSFPHLSTVIICMESVSFRPRLIGSNWSHSAGVNQG